MNGTNTMTKSEHIAAHNLLRIQMSKSIICDICIDSDDTEHEAFVDLLILLDEWALKFKSKTQVEKQ